MPTRQQKIDKLVAKHRKAGKPRAVAIDAAMARVDQDSADAKNIPIYNKAKKKKAKTMVTP